MTIIRKTAKMPYTVAQMYELVNHLENYPDFLPWCKDVTIQNRNLNKVVSIIHGYKLGIHFAFTLIYELVPNKLIECHLPYTGPFSHITGFWRFDAIEGREGSQFVFELQYELPNKVLNWTLTPLIKNEARNIMKAFYERARKVYG